MKIIMDLTCINFESYFEFLPRSRTRDELNIKTKKLNYNHAYYENFYFNRVVNNWNGIKYDTREALIDCEYVNHTKKIINEYLFQVFLEKFSPEIKCTWYVNCSCTNCKVV